jgi:hypothetical protein
MCVPTTSSKSRQAEEKLQTNWVQAGKVEEKETQKHNQKNF